jgi:hypothetical protein
LPYLLPIVLPLVCRSRLALGQEKKSDRAATRFRCGPAGRFLAATSFIDFQAAAVVTTVASVHGERLQRGGSSTRARRLSLSLSSIPFPFTSLPALTLPLSPFYRIYFCWVRSLRPPLSEFASVIPLSHLAGWLAVCASCVCERVYMHAPPLFVLLVLFDLIVQHQKQHFFVAVVFSLAPSGLSYPGQCLHFQFRPSV